MKIAAISDDEVAVGRHFGRAPLYVVATVENGEIINKETRDKTGHHTFAAYQHPEGSSKGLPCFQERTVEEGLQEALIDGQFDGTS